MKEKGGPFWPYLGKDKKAGVGAPDWGRTSQYPPQNDLDPQPKEAV